MRSRTGRPVVLECTPADAGADRRLVQALDADGHSVGRLDFQVCRPCRRGYIASIAVERQGEGIGREAVHLALASYPDAYEYGWSTSRQSRQGRSFFLAMAEETGVAFLPRAGRCPHMGRTQPGAGLLRLVPRGAEWRVVRQRRTVIGNTGARVAVVPVTAKGK